MGGFRFPGNFDDDDFGDFDDFDDEDHFGDFDDFLRKKLEESEMELKEGKKELKISKKISSIYKERSSNLDQQINIKDKFNTTNSVDELITLYNEIKEIYTKQKVLWSSNYEFLIKHDDLVDEDRFIEEGLRIEEYQKLIQESLLIRMVQIWNDMRAKEKTKKKPQKQDK